MDAATCLPDGYDADFLELPLPLPEPPEGTTTRELPYVLLNPARRLALVSALE
ncbi:hypothetical protein [Cryobacterium lactosi]|uniref:hypothetical protein n=1 Tax=Cryobacterium lactosi TaxID=1259202 RepID=UPI00141B4C6E|nr:hypothetical protein [Cryobacterium lactosi]